MRVTLLRRIIVGAIRVYQGAVSPFIGDCCRFQPSCSNYMIQAVERHGLWGVLLGVARILRCNPFCRGGYDPVPEKAERLS